MTIKGSDDEYGQIVVRYIHPSSPFLIKKQNKKNIKNIYRTCRAILTDHNGGNWELRFALYFSWIFWMSCVCDPYK